MAYSLLSDSPWTGFVARSMANSQHLYEIRPRQDRRGFDLISDCLPLGLLWFEGPEAICEAIKYAKFYSRSLPAVIRLFDESGTIAETFELPADFSGTVTISAAARQMWLGC
jgi:hypothetical protein